ncbi:molecular chaperone DnaJ [Candidatus Woesearchaeota archaeon]|nr:molecular chaperone DnaJ [Candidatus Woesearchaeota archaeon]
MTTKRDYYEILGVSKTTSKEDIKKAYKRLALEHHPDKGGDAEKFKEISEAYAVLSDDTKKQQYDQFGHAGFDQRYSQEDIFRNVNFDDIFGEVFGRRGDIFDMFFGGNRERRGNDLRYDLDISFEDAAFGVEKKIKIPRLINCDSCDGTGADKGHLIKCGYCNGTGQTRKTTKTPFGIFSHVATCRECEGYGEIAKSKCKECNGTGLIEDDKTLNIKIPAGVENGNRIRVTNAGEAIKNGKSGDLYIYLTVKPHEIFERKGSDIYLQMPLSFSQAALGDEIKVPTLEGSVKMNIPAGTQTGTTFRLRDKGVETSRGQGDQYVNVIVKTPTKLNVKQKKLLKEFAAENKETLKIEKGFFEKIIEGF